MIETFQSKGEFELIKKIRKGLQYSKDVIKGIGDDCAVIKREGFYELYTVDNMVEGIHFDLSFSTNFESIGFKSIARAVSDIGAMGGIPRFVLTSLALSDKIREKDFNKILKGVKAATKYFSIDIIGGDITSSPVLIITVTVIGECDSKPIFRNGAQTGNDIYVTGFPGLAKAALELLKQKKALSSKLLAAYIKPKPPINLAKILREKKIATAMIDISDGLVGDLKHILEESKKGAIIEEERLPFSRLFFSHFSPKECLDFVLNGGDDYELIFTAEKRSNDMLKKLSIEFRTPITKIGSITDTGDLYLLKNHRKVKIESHSYEHRFTFHS